MVAVARRAKNVSATSRKFGLSEKRIRLWQRQEEMLKNPDDRGKRTKKSYTAAYKLAAVQIAKHTSVAKAAKKLGVPEKCVRFWQQQEDTLKTVKQGAKKVRNFTPRHPEFEENVKNWVVSQHEKLLGVTTRQLQVKGAEIAKEMNLRNLLLNKQWCYRFIKRQLFGWNGQNILPEGFSDCDGVTEKIATFRDEIYHKVTELSIDTSDIINVDEMLLTLDLSSPENEEQRSGLENKMALESVLSELSFTVVLGVTATGEKKPPMMVLKSQSAPSGSFPEGVIVRCSETGCMDSGLMMTFLHACHPHQQGEKSCPKKTLLIIDSCLKYAAEDIQTKSSGIIVEVIPKGATNKLHPLDIGVKSEFEQIVQEKWENRAESDTMCKSLLENVAICVAEAWQQVKPTTILRGFQKAKLLPRKPTDPTFSSDSDTEAENSQFFEDSQAYSEENYQLAENIDTGADTTAGSSGVGDTNVNINLIDQYYADEKDLQNATTDIIEITGENQTRTPVYTTTDTTESTSETQTSTPIHTTEKSSECHEDKLERNYGERGEISSEDKSTDGSIRKTSTSDDEDTIKGNNAGETTSRNMEERLEKESVLDMKGTEEESSTSENKKYVKRHGKFRCKECSYESNIKSNIYRHERTKHRKSKESFECKICSKNFSSAYSLKSHLESHVNPYVCEFCSKRLTTKNGLKMHINKTHLSTASYECPICKKLYHMKSSLEGHVNTHSNHKPFKCSTCDKSFSWKSSLYTHLLVIPNINRIVST